MKTESFVPKMPRRRASAITSNSFIRNNGAALTPPAYGVEIVDRNREEGVSATHVAIQAERRISGKNVVQLMSAANGRTAVDTVRNRVPAAANRLYDIITTLGLSIDKEKLCGDILNASPYQFGQNDLAHTVPRAGVAGITQGAVCDNYQEMAIAEIDRSNLAGGNDTVHAESYPGHSYVSVSDASGAVNHDDDIIVDAWRNKVDRRGDISFFAKYRNNYTQWPQTPMTGGTDWMNDANAQTEVDNYLTAQGYTDPSRQKNMSDYIADKPGSKAITSIFLI